MNMTCLAVSLLVLPLSTAFSQMDSLSNVVSQIVAGKDATIGISITGCESRDSLSMNGDQHFPMQSVFKFPIALAVLQAVDSGVYTLDHKLRLTKDDLLPNTWSPLRDRYPAGNVDVTIRALLTFMVSRSDNNACDILLRLLGGPEVVERYVQRLGVPEISIKASEEDMHRGWEIQYQNWITPRGASNLLKKFYDRSVLSQGSTDFLWRIMVGTTTGKNRLVGQLPRGAVVAHKTGTSDTNDEGITAAINDIGIIELASGRHVAVSVFVSNSKEDETTNETIISDIARAVWDYFDQH